MRTHVRRLVLQWIWCRRREAWVGRPPRTSGRPRVRRWRSHPYPSRVALRPRPTSEREGGQVGKTENSSWKKHAGVGRRVGSQGRVAGVAGSQGSQGSQGSTGSESSHEPRRGSTAQEHGAGARYWRGGAEIFHYHTVSPHVREHGFSLPHSSKPAQGQSRTILLEEGPLRRPGSVAKYIWKA